MVAIEKVVAAVVVEVVAGVETAKVPKSRNQNVRPRCWMEQQKENNSCFLAWWLETGWLNESATKELCKCTTFINDCIQYMIEYLNVVHREPVIK